MQSLSSMVKSEVQNSEVQASQRELARHYIPASAEDIQSMLRQVGVEQLSDLYSHLPPAVLFGEAPDLPDELPYESLATKLESIAHKNNVAISYLGDGLPDFAQSPVVNEIATIRNLSTAYTPYQPERSQGTLMSHWIYQCCMSQLTGFEAVNASLYDRSTAIFEGICASLRLNRNTDTVIIPEALYPGDIEVLKTLVADTEINLVFVPIDSASGSIDITALRSCAAQHQQRLAAIVFPHINTLGVLEDVDALTDLAAELGVMSVAVVDPMLLATGGLKPPSAFGEHGAHIVVGEAQHLAIAPNFGGPGLGLFAVRLNDEVKNHVRSTPGRFVGKAKDEAGRDCRVIVMSTREQHIRKDKATSNICSNQAFLATLAGAAILDRGESGMASAIQTAHAAALQAARALTAYEGVELAYPQQSFFNEFTLSVPQAADALIETARQAGIHLGVNVSDRVHGDRQLIKLSFSDKHADITPLLSFFAQQFQTSSNSNDATITAIPTTHLRQDKVGLPEFSREAIIDYYQRLGDLNVSPDDGCYPLGSCTMKYNPHINDWAAGLAGFTQLHPQAPIADAQGCLEILFEIQEWFKKITGLAGITTQPVAGAQGELVGLKLFQAYHHDHSDTVRDVMLIPSSSHGTNFASAVMAGYQSKKIDGLPVGIVYLKASANGQIDMDDLQRIIDTYGTRISGVMITNPNTSGLFENRFHEIADKIHAIGGLVYMDGANMNAIAGWLDLDKLGVDAIHNNLHKTWTIPHGGGGPGDAIVAVSNKLVDYLPGWQIERQKDQFVPVKPAKSIGSFHRHWGNFAHKIRCYTYLLRLGKAGVRRMSAMAVLAARYLYADLGKTYASLPAGCHHQPRMHEFILTLSEADFAHLAEHGISKQQAIPKLGKLFLDFGFHAPTVAWPEALGLMIEPTESYTQAELDRLGAAIQAILRIVREHPILLNSTPHFTPTTRVDEVTANRELCLSETLHTLPEIPANRLSPSELAQMSIDEIYRRLIKLGTQSL